MIKLTLLISLQLRIFIITGLLNDPHFDRHFDPHFGPHFNRHFDRHNLNSLRLQKKGFPLI